ncbi:hypothetical protein T484DRAFT_2930317 [Baffinella frigidus]|nr:hypothetical protein T484DRAFT_2930317 [Cryptophyta sp. CCMP2293]
MPLEPRYPQVPLRGLLLHCSPAKTTDAARSASATPMTSVYRVPKSTRSTLGVRQVAAASVCQPPDRSPPGALSTSITAASRPPTRRGTWSHCAT